MSKHKFIIEARSVTFDNVKKFETPDVRIFSGGSNGWINITIPFILKKPIPPKRGRPNKEAQKCQ